MSLRELVIAMPAYNEEECIAEVVHKWCSLLRQLGLRSPIMIVVNDGSKDQTGTVLDKLKSSFPELHVIHQENTGHGRALRHAYDEAVKMGAEWVFQVDSDDQFMPSDFKLLWEQRQRSNFILGHRLNRDDPTHRKIITNILKLVNLLLFGRLLRDANIPFRLIRGKYLGCLLEFVPPHLFAPNIFLSLTASADGQDLINIPVGHKERQTGQVSIVRWRLIKACMRTAAELFIYRLRLGSTVEKLKTKKASLGL